MIVVSIDDFRKCAELSKQIGKWQAWHEHYFPKYKGVFSPMLKYLYRCNVTDLKDTVDNFDFDQALGVASKFFQDDGLSLTESLLSKSKDKCGFEQDYDLYLLIGLGQVDGTSLPAEKPFLYFGIERYVSPARLKYLVPHEYNHLVRLWSVYKGELREENFCLGDMVTTEGLAVIFSAIVANDGFSVENALLMPKEDIGFCREHREELLVEIQEHWNKPFTSELMSAYMTGSNEWKNGKPTRIGYFVGSQIVSAVLAKGYDICALTKMPTAEIMGLFKAA